MNDIYQKLIQIPDISSDETGTYPSDMLSGWFEEDVDLDTNDLILEFVKRFNKMTEKQRSDFIQDAEKTVEKKDL